MCEGRERCVFTTLWWLADPLLGQDLETQPRPGVCLTLESQDYISAFFFFADDALSSASTVGDLHATLGKFAAECKAAVIRINLTLWFSPGGRHGQTACDRVQFTTAQEGRVVKWTIVVTRRGSMRQNSQFSTLSV